MAVNNFWPGSGQLGLFEAYFEKCPSGCGRDRMDHDIMGLPCPEYLTWCKEHNPSQYDRIINRIALNKVSKANKS